MRFIDNKMVAKSYHSIFMGYVVQQQATSLFYLMTEHVTNDQKQNPEGCWL
jgi:hypothetical protein